MRQRGREQAQAQRPRIAAMVPDQLRPGQPRRQGPVGAAPPVIDMNDVDPVAPQETGAGQNAAQRSSEFPQGEGLARHERHLGGRSEEHTSELQSLMRISYAVFCLKKKKKTNKETQPALLYRTHKK